MRTRSGDPGRPGTDRTDRARTDGTAGTIIQPTVGEHLHHQGDRAMPAPSGAELTERIGAGESLFE
jgi:hypothetical protein